MNNNSINYGSTMSISGLVSSPFPSINPAETEDAQSLLIEAYEWIDLLDEEHNKGPDLTDSWQIRPFDVANPDEAVQWNKDRLWLMDPYDGILGDDAMPGRCAGCDGVYWGEDLMSVRAAINKLRKKNDTQISMFGNIWDEAEPHILEKLRRHRYCKKCFKVTLKTKRNQWSQPEPHWAPPAPINVAPTQPLQPPNNITIQPLIVTSTGAMIGNITYTTNSSDDDI